MFPFPAAPRRDRRFRVGRFGLWRFRQKWPSLATPEPPRLILTNGALKAAPDCLLSPATSAPSIVCPLFAYQFGTLLPGTLRLSWMCGVRVCFLVCLACSRFGVCSFFLVFGAFEDFVEVVMKCV